MGKVGTSDINRIDCISILVTLLSISRQRSVRLLGHTSPLSAKALRSLSSLKVSPIHNAVALKIFAIKWYFAYRGARNFQALKISGISNEGLEYFRENFRV